VRRVADPSDAADVVAEAFLIAWRRLDEVPDGTQARPWLFGVARHVLANHYRGERRRSALADRLRNSLPRPAATSVVAESAVEVALKTLGDDDREILRLVAWEELARDEIAVALGISRAAVRVRLHRARRRLVQTLDDVAARERPAEMSPVAMKQNLTSGHVSGGWAKAHSTVEEGS
jgi:RNA polymerase sigma-70 factor (ECF subfamily)